MGLCHAEPIVEIRKPGQPSILYGNVTSRKAADLVAQRFRNTGSGCLTSSSRLCFPSSDPGSPQVRGTRIAGVMEPLVSAAL
jgi:hypothetical protein